VIQIKIIIELLSFNSLFSFEYFVFIDHLLMVKLIESLIM